MNIVIETDRLLLRTFTENDALLMYDLNPDPDVARYTHDPVKDMAHAVEILEKVIIPQYVFLIMAGGLFLKSQDLNQ